MMKEYIEQRDGTYWVAGSRVSLDSLVTVRYAINKGQRTSRSIAQFGKSNYVRLSPREKISDSYVRVIDLFAAFD
ncbi:hypothetical protein PYK22_01422 [Pyrinomonas methylaliphatogenes]|uniref:Uncharacterized protein n=2 Tax=Pyrinomonas methylaliphatogenes TaxID=454194 RepID=A0A0B6WVX3_9BACT|nr:hypothetical protein PYK22_01422 [Pyrinomonas methylaliphatogenes]